MKRIIIILLAAAVIATCLCVILLPHSEYSQHNFTDNGLKEAYFRQVPLNEMDFNNEFRGKHFRVAINPISFPYLSAIKLPCDIHYFSSPDDSEPVLTLKKGEKVLIVHENSYFVFDDTIGYGLRCWPDYKKGWRFGLPFVFEEQDINAWENADQMYYVKTSELEKIAQEYYDANIDAGTPLDCNLKSDFVDWVTRFIDHRLYTEGVFCSKDL